MKKLVVIFMAVVLFAGIAYAEEKITLSTYYPAPYGDYEKLTVETEFLPPRMTTSERNLIPSPPNGSIIYNTTTDKINFRNPDGWQILSIE